MKSVFLLKHTHISADGMKDDKLVGVYETKDAANEALKRAVKLPGFDESS